MTEAEKKEKQSEVTATAGAEEEEKNQQGQNEETVEKIEMSKEDFEKTIQSETDKRVEQALKTQRSKMEQDLKKKIERERADAERLAKLSSEEREKEQFKRNQEELERKEQELKQREMKLAAIDILAEEKLPVAFADQLIGDSVDDTYDRISKFKKAWHDAVESEVKERLKGHIPDTGEKKPPPLDMNAYLRRMAGK